MRKFAVAVLFHAALLATLELALRWTAHHRPSYYMSIREAGAGTLHFPYGDISINHDGFPDAEFGPKTRPRIGYFGDSIVFGVGAGRGYRLSDRLRALVPRAQQLTFAGLGDGLTDEGTARLVAWVTRYRIDQAVYVMNLDDILPSAPPAADEARLVVVLGWLRREADWLRGRSYLYSYLRARVAARLTEAGYGTGGTRAYELFPRRYANELQDTARRIRRAHAQLAAKGVSLLVVILPYEMQISEEAARVYAADGIRWENGFVDGSPQRALREALREVPTLDATAAFVERPGGRSRNALGQFFVYNRGEKLDWVHPNRLGHAKLAQFLAESGQLLGSLP